MIRKLLLFTLLLCISHLTFPQKQNEVRIYYGLVDSKILNDKDLDGGSSYDLKNTREIGIHYIKRITPNFSLETGLNYFSADLEKSSISWGGSPGTSFESYGLLSIPLLARLSFWNYFFANAGPVIDFQTTDHEIASQSGIGYSLGLGAQYYFNNFSIFVNPNFRQHSLVSFEKENNQGKLTGFGIKMGIGYRF